MSRGFDVRAAVAHIADATQLVSPPAMATIKFVIGYGFPFAKVFAQARIPAANKCRAHSRGEKQL